ncbi:MAG: DUF4412 domain-containing protein [Gammaproteobacteria bacterium]|nr:DUF4412 domain-containing protein [Gammaproteobacteria bacterium]
MNKTSYLAIAMMSLALASTASAATLIESRADQNTMKMWIEGTKSRMDMPEQDGYVLTDAEQRKMYIISDKERTVMDMSSNFKSQFDKSKSEDLDIKLVKKRAGPTIAGYQTTHYTLSANGKHCADQYVSLKVLRDPNLKEYARHSAGMSNNSPIRALMDACTLASISATERFQKIGFPLRTVDADGDRHEVTRIQKNVSPGPNAFEVPKDYQIVDMGQIMQQALPGGLGKYLQQGQTEQGNSSGSMNSDGQANDASPMDAIGEALGESLKGLKGMFGN